MSSSNASTGSKRHAVEDDSSEAINDSIRPKRLKESSSAGDQTISKYFTRKDSRTAPSSRKANNKVTSSPSVPQEPAAASHSSQRKDHSISPPPISRQNTSSMSSKPEELENKDTSVSNDDNEKSHDPTLKITSYVGDIFAAPANALLIHACNCEGHWGKGIAAAFKQQYPEAEKIYRAHCRKSGKTSLVGTALLIPPQPKDRRKHYIGCLFTSQSSGMKLSPPQKILKATGPAMNDLLAQARTHISSGKGDISEIRICKINSKLFRVDWADTLQVLENDLVPHGFTALNVWDREEN